VKLPDVLLIDLSKRESFSSVLRETLQSSSIMRVHVLKNSFETFEAGGVETFLARLASFFDPDPIITGLACRPVEKAQLALFTTKQVWLHPPGLNRYSPLFRHPDDSESQRSVGASGCSRWRGHPVRYLVRDRPFSPCGR
jgi:hypothetical protein